MVTKKRNNMVDGWQYGLIEEEQEIDGEKQKVLMLHEIYFTDGKPVGAALPDWEELREIILEEENNHQEKKTYDILSEDIKDQITTKHFFEFRDGQIINKSVYAKENEYERKRRSPEDNE